MTIRNWMCVRAAAVVLGTHTGPHAGDPKPHIVFVRKAGKQHLAGVWMHTPPWRRRSAGAMRRL